MLGSLRWIFFIVIVMSSLNSYSFVELGGSGSYRKTYQDKNNYSTYRSGTISAAYYFWEFSALELNYTRARTDEVRTDYQSRGFIELYGLDFILNFAGRQSEFQPYVKVGVNYQVKEVQYKQLNQDVVTLKPVRGWAPSGGAGFKILISKNLAIKAGIDVWSSPLNEDDVTYDYAGRLGISFLF